MAGDAGSGRLTTADFESAGLLEGLDDEDERSARVDLLEQLAEAGVSIDEMKQAVDEDRLALLPVEQVLAGESKYTLNEVASEVGVDPHLLARRMQALGLPRPDPEDRRWGDEEIETARIFKQMLDAGLPEDDVLAVARVVGQGLSRAADAIRSLVGEALLQPGMTERDLGLRYAEAARRLGPAAGPLLQWALNLHLREGVKSDVVSRADLRSGEIAGGREVTVAFADLVGFTRLGGRIPASELGAVAGRLEEIANEAAEQPVKLVKTIGDAAMLVAPEPAPLLDAVLALVDRADSEGEDFPQVRAGVACGQAVGRGGDWYGHPVNLASRVTDIARPGSVLATREVRDEAGEGFRWSRAGSHKVRGVKQQVALYRARREGDEGGGGRGNGS